MKKIFSLLLFCFAFFASSVFACGGLTHMFIAQEAITLLPDAKLRNLLKDNLDAYLVGAWYPDSGYVKGNTYGEDSHWDPFIFTFADYIRETYPDPISQNPRLVAFLIGCAVHRWSDQVSHWGFYKEMAEHDFKGDWSAAHETGDPGIDLLLNIDKDQWFQEPVKWWIPMKDLLAVYHRMGKDEYTANQIRWGTSVLAAAGFGERLIAAPAYPYLKWKMPWTAKNYYSWPADGLEANEHSTANYLMQVWTRVLKKPDGTIADSKMQTIHKSGNPTLDFAETALTDGAISVDVQENNDGSIEINQPVVNKMAMLKNLLSTLYDKLFP